MALQRPPYRARSDNFLNLAVVQEEEFSLWQIDQNAVAQIDRYDVAIVNVKHLPWLQCCLGLQTVHRCQGFAFDSIASADADQGLAGVDGILKLAANRLTRQRRQALRVSHKALMLTTSTIIRRPALNRLMSRPART